MRQRIPMNGSTPGGQRFVAPVGGARSGIDLLAAHAAGAESP
jgi:hypothetical protein